MFLEKNKERIQRNKLHLEIVLFNKHNKKYQKMMNKKKFIFNKF